MMTAANIPFETQYKLFKEAIATTVNLDGLRLQTILKGSPRLSLNMLMAKTPSLLHICSPGEKTWNHQDQGDRHY
jgi:hypothetical protein